MLFAEFTDETMGKMVSAFYTRVREDDELGPIFSKHIGDIWDAHLDVITLFWMNVMMSDGRYSGNPMGIHMKLTEVEPHHFDIWLGYWRETACELFAEDQASLLIVRAERIAESLQLGMFNKIG
jgi:hemoglobin